MKINMKIIKIICILCTLLSINLNVISSEEEWIEVDDYVSFITAINIDDAKIKLTGNIEFYDNVKISKNITFDLNNKEINPKYYEFDITNNTLTIEDNSTEKGGTIKGEIYVNKEGGIVINEGIINGAINSSGEITINGGVINGDSGYAIYNFGVIHANGGEVRSTYNSAVGVRNGSIVTDESYIGTTFNCSGYNKAYLSGGVYNFSFRNNTNGIIGDGTFNDVVENNGSIIGGQFKDISGYGTISGENVTVIGTISGGTIYGTIKGDYTISGNKVTYKNNNGTYAVQVIQNGNTATAPIAPSRDKYSFIGWFIDENCTTEYDFTTKVDSDITLYAGYSPATITFDTKGGTTVNSITQEYGSTVTVETPKKKGYIFDGWDTTIPSTMPAHDMTISAKWTECTNHDLVEIVNDETLKSEATCNSKAIYYKLCSKCGYISDETFDYGDYATHKNLEHIERKEPTTEEIGNIEYYYCSTCKKYFSDSKGTNEITKEATVLNKLTKSSKTTTSSYDDGGPFITDSCGNVYDRWNNKIYNVTSCNAGGYNLVRTDVKD